MMDATIQPYFCVVVSLPLVIRPGRQVTDQACIFTVLEDRGQGDRTAAHLEALNPV